MAEILPMLALSPTMEQGTIVKWNKQEGDAVGSGDVLCEVETDKAVMEYEATVEGTLLKVLVPEGQAVSVGDAIAVVGEQGEDVSDLVQQAAAGKGEPQTKAKPPEEQSPGEKKGEDTRAEKQEKAPSAEAVAEARQAAQGAAAAKPPAGQPAAPVERREGVKASPLARRLADEAGLDLRSVEGSGPGGRVIKRDIERARAAPPAVRAAGGPGRPTMPAAMPAAGGQDRTLPLSNKRRITAQRLSESKFSAPHYYLTITVRMDALVEARRRLNEQAAAKVSFNAFLVKFVAQALARHPMVNAGWQGDSIRAFGSADIALAVALEDGLITPVVRACHAKGVTAIDAELSGLIERARAGKLAPEEFTNATFTISNLGSFGIDEFTAIINPPGAAILAVGRMSRQPVVTDGDRIEVQSLMKMTLSCDHRVIDGAVGAAFLKDLKDMMEDPVKALF